MGLFSDTCPECGSKVSKKARFCSKCGHGAPNGWTKCPQCGKWIGNDSNFCPHCNHKLFPEDRIDLAGGVWARKPGEFARRFELDDVRFLKENGLMVQEGTVAVLLDGGKEVKELGPGRHHPTGTLRGINWFGNPPPRSAVMVDSGECVFRVDFTGKPHCADGVASAPLRSAEELEVGCVAEITVKFIPGKAAEFIANVMKELRSVSAEDMCALLYENALSAVRDLCTQSTIEDLVKDPERRPRFEEAITRTLKEHVKACGLEIIRTGAVEFYGAAYEDVRAKYGELEHQRRLVEFGKAQMEILAAAADQDAAGQKRNAQRDQETADYLAQLAQEKDLTALERDKEMEIAVRMSKGEISAAEAKLAAARELEDHAKAMTALAHKLELDLTLRNYDRDQLVADAENKARLNALERAETLKDAHLVTEVKGEELSQAKIADEIERIRIGREQWESSGWVDVRVKKDEAEIARKRAEMTIKMEELRIKAELVKGLDAVGLAGIFAEDPSARDAFLKNATETLRLNNAKGMTPEQLVAMVAGESPEAAKALADMTAAQKNGLERVIEELKRVESERHTHDDRILDKMASIAEKVAEHQTTVVPPAPVTNMQH